MMMMMINFEHGLIILQANEKITVLFFYLRDQIMATFI